MVKGVRRSAVEPILELHHALITLLARHKLGDHGTVLLIDGGLVSVGAAN